ncbi:MAG: hypothetical protein U0Y82_12760 [Thermoleophilia bacterium]|mgnify:CR=1 FL=1
MNRDGVRNLIIVLALAAVVYGLQAKANVVAVSLGQIITVLFLAAVIVFAYHYFREHELAWLVIPSVHRRLIVACAIGIVLLLTVGFPLLAPYITSLGVVALAAALGVAIAWMIRESRRFK